MKMKDYANIDEYIKSYPRSIQLTLEKMRATVNQLVPNGEEAIRYGMPTIRLNGKNLLHYAAFNDHIGFYPTSSGIKAFRKELGSYVTGKGTISFPINEEIPWDIVKKIIKFRLNESTNNPNG